MNEINVVFPQGKTVTVPAGTKAAALADTFETGGAHLAAVWANNEVVPLAENLTVNTTLKPILLESVEGARVHRHTLSFLFCIAAKKVFPEHIMRIGHSLGKNYYFSFHGGEPPKEQDIQRLKDVIDDFVRRDLIIEKKEVAFGEALSYFKKEKQHGTVLLLEQSAESKIKVNALDDYIDIYTNPLLFRTGLVSLYDIKLYNDGFLLCYPVVTGKPPLLELKPFEDLPKIFSIFSEYKKWGRIVGVHTVGQLNECVARREIKDFIYIAEAFAEKKLSQIADLIYTRRDDIKLVLIAGPSSSGKTTTAKKVSIQLKTLGIEPVAVSLDDYYLHPDLVPKDENGNPDFECLESLDVPFLNEQLLALFKGKEVALPQYDFKTCTRREGRKVRLGRRTVLVLEGIHGLNDALTPEVRHEHKFKIYASALTQLNLDDHNRIATTDNRLLRRMVRDYQFRGMGAERTLRMWPDVQRGAEKHIFKFQNGADAVFNSALDYEIAVLKLYAEPLLRSVRPDCEEFSEAARLLLFLKNFSPIPPDNVPGLSLLREFIGGSGFKY